MCVLCLGAKVGIYLSVHLIVFLKKIKKCTFYNQYYAAK